MKLHNPILLVLGLVCFAFAWHAEAQTMKSATFENVMLQVASGNLQLRAARKQLETAYLQNHSQLALPDPEVEVACLFGHPKSIGRRGDVSVTQTLDWGVLLGQRKQLALTADNAVQAQYRAEVQQVLAEADKAYVSIVFYNKLIRELTMRHQAAQTLLALYEKNFSNGNTNQLELNKVRLNASTTRAELLRAESERTSAIKALQTLCGGTVPEIADTVYPMANEALPPLTELRFMLENTPQRLLAESGVAQSKAAARLARTEGMPQLTVGFQGEYVPNEKYSGLSVGFTLPLWGNSRKRVKSLRTEAAARELDRDNVVQTQSNLLEQQYGEATRLLANATQLNADLQATSNARLLQRSLEEGQISLLDYLLELTFYYSARTAQLEAERDAQLAVAALRAWQY